MMMTDRDVDVSTRSLVHCATSLQPDCFCSVHDFSVVGVRYWSPTVSVFTSGVHLEVWWRCGTYLRPGDEVLTDPLIVVPIPIEGFVMWIALESTSRRTWSTSNDRHARYNHVDVLLLFCSCKVWVDCVLLMCIKLYPCVKLVIFVAERRQRDIVFQRTPRNCDKNRDEHRFDATTTNYLNRISV